MREGVVTALRAGALYRVRLGPGEYVDAAAHPRMAAHYVLPRVGEAVELEPRTEPAGAPWRVVARLGAAPPVAPSPAPPPPAGVDVATLPSGAWAAVLDGDRRSAYLASSSGFLGRLRDRSAGALDAAFADLAAHDALHGSVGDRPPPWMLDARAFAELYAAEAAEAARVAAASAAATARGRRRPPPDFDAAAGALHAALMASAAAAGIAAREEAVMPQRSMTVTAPRIVRLIKIVDTREREERDGMYTSFSVPVPGTGTEHACHRCGAPHEVHAYVELDDASVVVVGTGCAKKAALDAGDAALARSISTAERRAKVRAAVVADIARLRRLVAEREESARVIATLPVPAVVWVDAPGAADGYSARWRVVCGDAVVWSHQGRERVGEEPLRYTRERIEERERSARESWAERRHVERGTGGYDHQQAARHLAQAADRLAKIDAAAEGDSPAARRRTR